MATGTDMAGDSPDLFQGHIGAIPR